MPIYEYRCQDCRSEFEQLVQASQRDAVPDCPHCGGTRTERKLSVFSAPSAGVDALPTATGGCMRCGDPRGPCGT